MRHSTFPPLPEKLNIIILHSQGQGSDAIPLVNLILSISHSKNTKNIPRYPQSNTIIPETLLPLSKKMWICSGSGCSGKKFSKMCLLPQVSFYIAKIIFKLWRLLQK